MTTPDPRAAQRTLALARAQHIREAIHLERAHISALPFEEAAERVAEILDDPGVVLAAMRVGHMLRAIDQIGPERMRRMVAQAGITSADRKLRQLTARQRGELAWLVLAWSEARSAKRDEHIRRKDRLAA